MMKHILSIALLVLATNTMAHTESYYSLHLSQLQKDIKHCPQKHPQDASCEQLQQYAERANELADELRINPQNFGKKILSLQETQAMMLAKLQKEPAQVELQTTIDETNMQIAQRIAVVKWLESPKG